MSSTGRARVSAIAMAIALLAAASCSDNGGPNTQVPFRVVLLEPRGSTNVACNDTIRVTFNIAIDTTAVFDDQPPRYFLASITSGGVLRPGTFLSNEGRTLNLPFTFTPSTNFQFTFNQARGENGRPLETPAETTFTTVPCP